MPPHWAACPPQQVEDIINNPVRAGGQLDNGILGAGNRLTGAAIKGIGEAAGWAVDKLFPGDHGDTIRDATNFDPAFETERGAGEKIAEVGGQIVPAGAAAIGAAGGGWIPAAIAGAGVATLTFDDEDSIGNVVDELAGGNVLPDFLVVGTDDDNDTRAMKHLAANLVADGLFGALGAAGAKLYRIFKDTPSGFVDMDALKALSDEAGIPLRADAPVPTMAPRDAEALKVPEAVITKARTDASTASVAARLDEVAGGAPRTRAPAPEALEGFMTDITKRVQAFEARTVSTTDFGRLADDLKGAFDTHARDVFSVADTGRIADATRLLKDGARWDAAKLAPHEVNSIGVHNMILTKSVLDKVDADFKAIVMELRRNPDQSTKAALDKVAREHLEDLGDLWDHYRNLGTSASHQLLARKGFGNSSDFLGDMAEDFVKASDDVATELAARGITLYDTEGTFVAKKILAFDDAGVSPGDFVAKLYDEFSEYEKTVAGIKANVRHRAKLTPMDQLGMIAKGVQFLKDLQSTMLLGQFMTSGLEVLSTGFNALLLPTLRAVGGGDRKRWAREMSGLWHSTALARANAGKSFAKGKDITDDFFMKEGAFSRTLDHETMSLPASLVWRVFSIAVDVAQSSAAFFKTARAYGLAYADGLEAALANGMAKGEARKAAKQYAAQRFDANGAIIDEDFRIRAGQSAFQMAFDGLTLTGRLGQRVENLRNSQTGFGTVGLAARGVMPFFRTLTNIGHNSAQMVLPPGVGVAIKRLFPEGTNIAKFLDDFSGKNGVEALQAARGRNRVGMALTATAFSLTQMDNVEITGPSRGQRWDAKKRSFEEFPASSLIIGNTAIDLSRFLPFSAPLLLAGTLRDYQLEDALRMEGGEYDPTGSNLDHVIAYLTGTGITTATVLQDASAAQGVFDLFDAVAKAVEDGNPAPMTRYAQQYATQFTPGPLKMAARAGGGVQHEGYTFWERWKASAGLSTDWERMDFLGNPIRYPTLRGIDPSNRRILRLDDPVYAEFAFLNKVEGLALVIASLDRVFTSSEWRAIGLETNGVFGGELPSLVNMKTKDGRNAWETYRRLVYEATPSAAIQKTVPNMGVRVEARKGENFEAASRRLIGSQGYRQATPEGRAAYWNTLHGIYKAEAKEKLKEWVMVEPAMFDGSRYGSPVGPMEALGDTLSAGKALAAEINRTRGDPLDEAFAIK